MTTYSINKEIHIQASKQEIFEALTNSAEIIKYYPLSEVISDWKIGAEVLYKGEANGISFTDFGTIEVLEPPCEYKYRYWSDNHNTERTPENHLSIRYKLVAENDGTLLILEQENIGSRELYELMNETVWDFLLQSLKNHVESNITQA